MFFYEERRPWSDHVDVDVWFTASAIGWDPGRSWESLRLESAEGDISRYWAAIRGAISSRNRHASSQQVPLVGDDVNARTWASRASDNRYHRKLLRINRHDRLSFVAKFFQFPPRGSSTASPISLRKGRASTSPNLTAFFV